MTKFQILLVRFILRWLPADPFADYSSEDPTNNFAFLTIFAIHPSLPEKKGGIHRITNESVICWAGEQAGEVEIPIAEISSPKYRIRLYKRGWNIHYESLLEAAIDLAGRFYLKRLVQSIYNKRLQIYEDRIGVLKAALDIKKELLLSGDESFAGFAHGDHPIRRTALLSRIYGNRISLSPSYSSYYEVLGFHLDAWIESGELAQPPQGGDPSKFVVTPKSINTIAQHELDMQKHRDTLRPAKIVAVTSMVIVVATLLQLYLAFGARSDVEENSVSEPSKGVQSIPY